MLEAEERLALAIRRWERHPVVGSGLVSRSQLDDLLRLGRKEFGSLDLLTILELSGKAEPQDIANCIWPNIPFLDAGEIPPVPDDLAELTSLLDAELQGFIPFKRQAGRIHLAIHDLERNLALVKFQLNHGPVSIVAVSPLAFRANLQRWFEERGSSQDQGAIASTRPPIAPSKEPLAISWRTEASPHPIEGGPCSLDQGPLLKDDTPDSHTRFHRIVAILREETRIRAGHLEVEESISDGTVMDDCRHVTFDLSKIATDHIFCFAKKYPNNPREHTHINVQNLQKLARLLALENQATILGHRINDFQSSNERDAVSDALVDDLNNLIKNLPEAVLNDWEVARMVAAWSMKRD